MCIISGQYDRVFGTKLFGARCGNEQLTVYSNAIKQQAGWNFTGNNKPIVMILPVPLFNGTSTDIRMTEIDANFFDTLDEHMISTKPQNRGGAFSFGKNGVRTAQNVKRLMCKPGASLSRGALALPVYECGNYQYSVVGSCEEFLQLDESVLPLDPVIKQTMQQYYATQNAFLVCKMKNSTVKYTPIGYIHPGNPDGTIRLPTVHVHFNQPRTEYANDWDHAIYVVAQPHTLQFPSTQGQDLQERKEDAVLHSRSDILVNALQRRNHHWAHLVDWRNLKKYEIQGTSRNFDLYC